MKLDRKKARQALTEWGYAFVALVLPAWLAFANGIKVGDGGDKVTVFPDLATLKALAAAVLAAAGLSFCKAVLWFISGTVVPAKD